MDRYADLRAHAAEFVRRSAPAGPVLVLGPTRAAADEVAHTACGVEGGFLGVHRLAFRDLVMELAASELYRRELVPVGRFVREAIAARVTAEAKLTYLGPVASFPGFPRALTNTFEELRLNSVSPARLRECGQSGPDLAWLLESYDRELTARKFADYAVRVSLATGAMAADRYGLRQMSVVALDIAPRTQLERELFELLTQSARERLVLRLGQDGAAEPATPLESLQRHLFSDEGVRPQSGDGSVELFSTSGEALEGVEIARRITAAAEHGVPFDEVAILLRSPQRHQPLVVEALRRAGIPAHCTLGSLRPDAAGRSFLALLYCAEEGLPASRFAEYLSLGQIPDEEEPVTPALWERLLVDAAVIGGPERWETRLRGLNEEFHRRHGLEEDEEERSAWVRKIVALENLARLALPVIGKLAALPARAVWGEWTAALIDVAEFTLSDSERVVELLEELEPMADIGPVGLGEVLLVLAPRLSSLAAAPKGARYGKVWVGAVEEARGMAFRRVFVPGVNEGLFPRPPAEDPLLLHAQREALGIELREEDTELLRVAVACASERLAISFSRLDLLTGRERVPSYFAFEAHRAAGGPDLDVREFEARARAATGTRIGWPAPVDPADALDDAEFDLATLAPRAKGSGQYLKSLPGRAVYSLRARWVRWHKPWKAADGLFIEEIGSDALLAYRLSARAWSPSVLQQYARCPYRFALRGIHGLRPAEQPGGIQRMDPATRGQIFHAVQYRLLRDLNERGLLPVHAGNLAAALDRLDTVLPEVAEEFEAKLAPAIPQIWRSEVQAIRADLRGWLQQKSSLEADWTPEYFELSFGLKDPAGRDPHSRKDAVEVSGGFHLQGSIDLVERHRSGVLRVVDHKTGKIPEPRPEMVGGGEVLQPTLYAMAAEKLLGEPVSLGRLFYATLAQNFTPVEVPLNEWARRRAEHVLRTIDDAMRDGFLPAAPRKDGCKGCEYLPVCGPYEEERVREKSHAELKGLKELRGWR
jgi:ATP-dependent helicase/nuclease subunit B